MNNHLRRCVSCREYKEKTDLIRINKNKDNEYFIDDTYKHDGRGAYVCKTQKCIEKTIKYHGLNKSLHSNVPANIYEALDSILKEYRNDNG